MKEQIVCEWIEPYNFMIVSPNTHLQSLIIMLKNRTHKPIIVKENGKLLGYLPLSKIPEMILKSQTTHKPFNSILVETFFVQAPIIVSSHTILKKALETIKLQNKLLYEPFLGVENNHQFLISTFKIQDIIQEIEV